MCQKDEWITSSSTGETKWNPRGNGMQRCTEGFLVKAGSAYYHNPNTQENFWLEYEVIPSVIEEGDGSLACTSSHGALVPEGGSGLSAAEPLLQDIRNFRLTGGNRNDIIKEIAYNPKNTIQISRYDFGRLIRGHQLNDVIINAYISVLNARQTTNSHVMHTTAMWYLERGRRRLTGDIDPLILKDNIQCLIRTIKKTPVDIKKRDRIIMPIHSQNGTHWEMCVIDLKCKFIRYYDSCDGKQSMNHTRRQNLNMILEWIVSYWELETKSDWKHVLVSKAGFNIPSQAIENDRDCGILMLKYIECIVSGQPLDDMCKVFTLGDSRMKEIREHVAKKLLLV